MRSASMRIGVCVSLSLSLLLGGVELRAQPSKTVAKSTSSVKIGISAEGRKIIYNEGVAHRARRTSTKLVAADPEIEPLIIRHSDAQQLDPKLVKALIQVESGYNQRARSNKGAMGLMQLMPGTASDLRVQNPYDPDDNLRGGTAYLRQMIDRFNGKLEWAVAAYNAGPGAVERYGGIPPYNETRNYVRRVLSLYQGAAPALGVAGSLVPVVNGAGGIRRKPHLIRNSQNRLVLTSSLDGVR
jgi:soluble lytic murein transglycosylase-like protein